MSDWGSGRSVNECENSSSGLHAVVGPDHACKDCGGHFPPSVGSAVDTSRELLELSYTAIRTLVMRLDKPETPTAAKHTEDLCRRIQSFLHPDKFPPKVEGVAATLDIRSEPRIDVASVAKRIESATDEDLMEMKTSAEVLAKCLSYYIAGRRDAKNNLEAAAKNLLSLNK